MSKVDLSDLFGDAPSPAKPTPAKAGVKPPTKPKGAVMAKADTKETATPGKLKPKAGVKPAKPAAKAAKPKATGEKSARGGGKFYFDPKDREALAKKIGGIKTAITTKELAKKIGEPTWKVRLAAVSAAEAKAIKLVKKGVTLTITPK